MRRLDLSTEAELDIFEAALWYETERQGLGFRFEQELGRLFTRIRENPLQFPAVEAGVRRALTNRFPYGIFFRVEPAVVTVMAVMHLHRDPETWKRRL